MIETGTVETPLGGIRYATRNRELVALTFTDDWARFEVALERWFPGDALAERSNGAGRSVARYFAGDLSALNAIAVAPVGTRFQQRVWRALRQIRPGTTTTYAEVARRIGSPTAVRAVGTATGANPVGIVIPCHRVVRTDGGLGGYATGLDRKRWLLQHERG